jgi:hypothetical protein
MGRPGGVLAWVSDGCQTRSSAAKRVRAFITRSAPAESIVHFAADDSDFKAHLRSGEFGVYVVATVPGAGGSQDGHDEGAQHECAELEHDDGHAGDCEDGDHDGHHDDGEESHHDGARHADARKAGHGGRDDRQRNTDEGEHEHEDDHEHNCAPGCRSLSRLTERELTEAVFRGAGLVVLKSGPNEVPALREASGVHVQGQEQEELVRLIESAFTQPGLLAIGGGVELELEGGAAVGWFGESGDEVAISAHQFGIGEAVVFGFDLAAALPPEVASETFARTVTFAAGESELLPAGMVGVRIRVENRGSLAEYRLVETVAPELQVAHVLDGGKKSASGAVEWTGEVAASEPDTLRYFVRLPTTPGAFDTKTQLFLTSGTSERLVAETSLALVLTGSRASLESSAEAVIGRLPTTGPDGAVRKQLTSALDNLKMNTGSSADSREQAIETLLDAADLAMKLRTVDPTPVRVALDRLLAYWEMKP